MKLTYILLLFSPLLSNAVVVPDIDPCPSECTRFATTEERCQTALGGNSCHWDNSSYRCYPTGKFLCEKKSFTPGSDRQNVIDTETRNLPSPEKETTVPESLKVGTHGDPHFRTWNNEHFEYHGQCDMILIKDKHFSNELGLEVQIRTKLVRFWSYIKSVAIRIGDDILEVQGQKTDDTAVSNYWINLEYQGALHTIEGFPVIFHIQNKHKLIYTIDLSSNFPGQQIKISTYNEFVRVDFVNASEDAFGNTIGLLGEFGSGKTLARDGSTVLDDFSELGGEWQVLPFEPMLFHDVSQPQFPHKCIQPENPRGQRHRQLSEETVTTEEAEATCAHLPDDLDQKECVYDILATQDLDMVGAY